MENNQLPKEQEVYMLDEMYLPIHYKTNIIERPIFKGEGNHSVRELEVICKQFEEYTHQQQIIKQNCKQTIIELKFNDKLNQNNINSIGKKIINDLNTYSRSVNNLEYGLPIDPDFPDFDTNQGEKLLKIVTNILQKLIN